MAARLNPETPAIWPFFPLEDLQDHPLNLVGTEFAARLEGGRVLPVYLTVAIFAAVNVGFPSTFGEVQEPELRGRGIRSWDSSTTSWAA
jgi:hypothetical protein